ncbi:nudix hydrolase [Escherichia phage T4]|nr:nudix hydrolase [Escherichia phage T4]
MQEIKMKTLSAGIIFMTEDKDLWVGLLVLVRLE